MGWSVTTLVVYGWRVDKDLYDLYASPEEGEEQEEESSNSHEEEEQEEESSNSSEEYHDLPKGLTLEGVETYGNVSKWFICMDAIRDEEYKSSAHMEINPDFFCARRMTQEIRDFMEQHNLSDPTYHICSSVS